MKRSAALLTLLILFAFGCASTKKLPGRYGLVIDDNRQSWRGYVVDDSVLYALREQLGRVDVIASPTEPGYDAVIVLSSGPSTQWHIEPERDDIPDAQGTRQQLVYYQILRGGAKVAEGAARVEHTWPPPIDDRSDTDSYRHQQTYAGALEVARVVVKALRDAG